MHEPDKHISPCSHTTRPDTDTEWFNSQAYDEWKSLTSHFDHSSFRLWIKRILQGRNDPEGNGLSRKVCNEKICRSVPIVAVDGPNRQHQKGRHDDKIRARTEIFCQLVRIIWGFASFIFCFCVGLRLLVLCFWKAEDLGSFASFRLNLCINDSKWNTREIIGKVDKDTRMYRNTLKPGNGCIHVPPGYQKGC